MTDVYRQMCIDTARLFQDEEFYYLRKIEVKENQKNGKGLQGKCIIKFMSIMTQCTDVNIKMQTKQY